MDFTHLITNAPEIINDIGLVAGAVLALAVAITGHTDTPPKTGVWGGIIYPVLEFLSRRTAQGAQTAPE